MLKETSEINEITLIQKCILLSCEISKVKQAALVLFHLNQSLSKCRKKFPDEKYLPELKKSMTLLIDEYSMDVSKLLKPLLVQHGIYLTDKYWFTASEIKDGFILFRKGNALVATHVLFLKNMIDSFDGTTVKEGDIRLYKHVTHFLEKLEASRALEKAKRKSKIQ